jgi:NAD-dependent SIR2 family protein deacetylase
MPLQEILSTDDRPLQDIADLLVKSRRVVVITGAGISTSCGIPDFRSKDGLYNLIPDQPLPTPPPSEPSTPRKRKASDLEDDSTPPSSQVSITSQRSTLTPKLRGQDLFDASVWKNPAATATFYQFIASLRQKIKEEVQETSWSHRLIRALRDGGRLIRCYTQNIDGLEARDGLETSMARGTGTKRRFMRKTFQEPRPSRILSTDFDGGCEVVQLHGDLEKTRCNLCQHVIDWDETATSSFLDGKAPGCEQCMKKNDEREAKGKRGMSVGLLRPNIVLYGEEHPSNHLLAPFVPFDLNSNPEVVIIMGTSLKVFGLQKIVKDFAKQVHSRKDGKGKVIFVNRSKPAESVWEDVIDQYVAMDCDDWVRDLRVRRDDLWLRQGELDLKVTKPAVKRKRKQSEASCHPAKNVKTQTQNTISVEIPRKVYLSDTGLQPAFHGEEARLTVPRLSHDDGGEVKRRAQAAPSTPSRPRTLKHTVFDNPRGALLSPMAPPYSPLSPLGRPSKLYPRNLPHGLKSPTTPSCSTLRKSFNAPAPGPLLPHTPEQPGYSPITPWRRKTEIYVFPDRDTEINESGDDTKVAKSEEIGAGETPIRKTARKPLSESISNVKKDSAWTAASAQTKSNELVLVRPDGLLVEKWPQGSTGPLRVFS